MKKRPLVVRATIAFIAVVALLLVPRVARAYCTDNVRAPSAARWVASGTATETTGAQLPIGPGGPVYVRVRSLSDAGAAFGVYVHRPKESLLTSACAKASLLSSEGEEYWLEVLYSGDSLPVRVVEVLVSPTKFARVQVDVFQTPPKPAAPSPVSADRLTFRLRAFIPADVTGYSRPVPTRPGLTMIPGPGTRLPQPLPSIPPAAFSDCYLTDGRDFSSQQSAASKLETQFSLEIDTQGRVIVSPSAPRDVHKAGLSTRVNCDTGRDAVPAKAGDLRVAALGTPAIAGGRIQIAGQAAVSNPHLASPWIDYSFDFVYDTTTHTLKWAITTGRFPAFEAYVYRGSKVVTILRVAPQSASAWGLIDAFVGINTDRHEGIVQL